MQNPLTTNQAKDSALLLARVPIGILFLLAGYAKFAGGYGAFVDGAMAKLPHFISPQFGKLYLQALPVMEMLVGVAFVVGFYTRIAATLASLMLLSFIIAETGIAFEPLKSPAIAPNVIYLGLCILLMTTGGGNIAVDHSFGKSAPGPGKK